MFLLICVSLFLATTKIHSQSEDDILLNKASWLLYDQPQEAIKIADYIIKKTSSPSEKNLKAQLILAESGLLLSDYKTAITCLFNTKEALDVFPNQKLKNKNSILFASLYRQLGLLDKAKQALEFIPKDKDLKGRFYFEQGLIEANLKNQDKATSCFNKSLDAYKSLPHTQLSSCLIGLSRLALAENSLETSEKLDSAFTDTSSPQLLKHISKKLQAKFLYDKEAYNESLALLTTLMPLENSVKTTELRKQLFEIASRDYYALGDFEKYLDYDEQFNALEDSLINIEKEAHIALYARMLKYQKKTVNQKGESNKIKGIIILTILSLIVAFLIFYRVRQHVLEKKKTGGDTDHKSNNDLVKPQEHESKTIVIPDDTKYQIIQKLNAFEKNMEFLDARISLTSMAKKLNTNTKYLSEIINTEKEVSFTRYINQLRIDYIQKKLAEEPTYRKYKISYLAKESGFVSHSTFATTFKSHTGESPTAYISRLQKKEKNNRI
ncbi:AraC family transcriptional regulator [Winogradskyella sp. SYSU M77433]|uniref:AraC family transcriptional regulator n=1 Tax=Winogradskyella sp. SYSU M77433 TaxID=3042722 RepID=UPI00247FFF5C|nr:AraC family transcriptional regulator [Winogradskyella sp. SYSU M77433]MDH7911546.1 helix-turn-helix domain-containing protein [Winogradskyella sp. SYSU M77433]